MKVSVGYVSHVAILLNYFVVATECVFSVVLKYSMFPIYTSNKTDDGVRIQAD